MVPYKYLVNSPFYIFLTGLFLLPLIYSISPRVDYELVKVAFFQHWVEVFCLSVIIFTPEKLRLKRISHFGSVILLLMFFGIALFSSYIGTDYSKSFWGNSFRGDGLFTLFHGILLFIFLQFAWEAGWRRHITHVIILASISASLYALGHGASSYMYGIVKYSPFEGIYGTMGHPAFLGGFLVLTLPFFFTFKRKLAWLPVLLPVLAIIFTYSRFAILGILLVPVLWLSFRCVKLLHIGSGIRSHIGIFAFFVYLVFSACYFGFYAYRASSVSQEYIAGKMIVYEERMRIYTKGFLGFLERPVLGYGYANFDKAFERRDWPARIPKDVYVDKAHSNWLETLATTGFIGFALYVSFLFLLFNRLKWNSSFNQAVMMGFLLYILNSQVNVTSIAQDALFWTFAGILTKESYN